MKEMIRQYLPRLIHVCPKPVRGITFTTDLLVLSPLPPMKTCDTMLQSSAVTKTVNNPFAKGPVQRSRLADVIPPILNLPSYVSLAKIKQRIRLS